MKQPGYGVETLLILYYKAQKKRLKYIALWGLVHPIKVQKHTFFNSLERYKKEIYEITRTLGINYSLLLLVFKNQCLSIIISFLRRQQFLFKKMNIIGIPDLITRTCRKYNCPDIEFVSELPETIRKIRYCQILSSI